ncbi:hypothetical protein [Saccharothrix deserti]|uniref:hypothetical protein n=1 Tax=Saccharothrix deserti TaxID=2593674 RepID=UPI00131B0871|nr:hypothetical protein [Saccharothrix deserti]
MTDTISVAHPDEHTAQQALTELNALNVGSAGLRYRVAGDLVACGVAPRGGGVLDCCLQRIVVTYAVSAQMFRGSAAHSGHRPHDDAECTAAAVPGAGPSTRREVRPPTFVKSSRSSTEFERHGRKNSQCLFRASQGRAFPAGGEVVAVAH